MIIKEEKEVRIGGTPFQIVTWKAVFKNFLIFILVTAVCCTANYELGTAKFLGVVALFIPFIIWVIFKVDLMKKMPKKSNILRYLSFIPLIIFIFLSPFRSDFTEYFYFNLWIISNVSLFEFSHRIGPNIFLKILAYILLSFIAIRQLYSGTPLLYNM
jgi:hypothetical protein